MALEFVANPFVASRRPTREVKIGDVGVGGDNPIRVQSMTTADTLDTTATCDEVERLALAGCEIVRITAPSIREAENLREIRAELERRRVRVPLVADIHFTPNAALVAAEVVEKVRINPGNYADRKKFEVREYDDAAYAVELERVAGRFRPLVLRCKELGRALRIGTNHGSLSDRIMNRFGDTPTGMVESALEFLDVCEDCGYYDVVFSMKSSNAQVAIQAYRLLAARLDERARECGERESYPFHVGVTEAGDAEDGRVKSAIGIGALLEDGIGDTVRVSLTEDPVREVPVARVLARRSEDRWREDVERSVTPLLAAPFVGDPYVHARRSTDRIETGALALGGDEPVRVELELGRPRPDIAGEAARLATALGQLGDLACEGLCLRADSREDIEQTRERIAALRALGVQAPLVLRLGDLALASQPLLDVTRVTLDVAPGVGSGAAARAARAVAESGRALEWCLRSPLDELPGLVDLVLEASGETAALLLSAETPRATHAARVLAARLHERGRPRIPIVLRHRFAEETARDAAIVEVAIDLGAPLCDGIGDAVCLAGFDDPGRAVDLAYRVLQGARLRTTRTEYISCPSCGRTQFDLEETTARVKAKTEHLKGVKIAVMGCIVNGPGEMADADFGYVGAGRGVVNLYVGKQIVERGVSQDVAPERLFELIRTHGRWMGEG